MNLFRHKQERWEITFFLASLGLEQSLTLQAHSFNRKKGELRIIGAISIDLDGISDEGISHELDEEAQAKVKLVLNY